MRGPEGRRSHPEFLTYVRTVAPYYQDTPFHTLLCGRLQKFYEDVRDGGSPRLMLTMPPRHGKSETGSVLFPSWVLGEQPDWPIIHTSYTAELSNGFSRKVRNLLREPVYRRLYPDIAIAQDSRSVAHWNLASPMRGVFTSAGVGGPITGRGAKVAIIDDPVKNLQDADSEAFRRMQREWYTSTLYTRLEDGGGILLIQTRWHTDDLGGYVTTGAGTDVKPDECSRWEVMNLPALCELPDDPLGRSYGEALWPEKYPVQDLERIRGTLPERQWRALYQQQPITPEGNLLKTARIHDTGGLVPRALYIVQAWDLAISEKTTADYSVGFTLGIDRSNMDVYLLDRQRGRWDFNGVLSQIDFCAQRWRPLCVAIESNAFQAAVVQEARRRYMHPFYEFKADRDKVVRAQLLADRILSGKVFADKSAPWWREFEDEALAFPQGSHDDQVDACVSALASFSQMRTWRVAA